MDWASTDAKYATFAANHPGFVSISKYSEEACMAVELCIEKHLYGQAAILMFALIDVLSWLYDTDTKRNTVGTRFRTWVDRYMLCDGKLKCNSHEIWSLRNAYIHEYGMESDQTRNRRARFVLLCYGSDTRKNHNLEITIKVGKAVVLHIDELFDALKQGMFLFASEIVDGGSKSGKILKKGMHLNRSRPIR